MRNKNNTRLALAFAALALFACLLALPATAAPLMQGTNLLQNPNFEGSLSGWTTWYYDNIVMQADNKKMADLDLSFYPPAFVLSEPKWDHESGGKQDIGSAAAISGIHFTKFRGGLYQTVHVAPGSRVRFRVWMNAFCEDDKGRRCPIIVRAGIDPTGGTDWQSKNIRWVETQIGNQQYVAMTPPDVQVPDGTVTVFVWGEPRFPVIYSAAYADEASLVVTVPPTPTGAAPTVPPPSPTPVSCAQLGVAADATDSNKLVVAPGVQFVKAWRLQNSGTCAWSGTLSFVGNGDQMEGSSPTSLPTVDVGQSTDVSLNLTAPIQPGSYQGTWEVRTGEGIVLGRLVVSIEVAGGTPTPDVVVAVTPQSLAASPTPEASQICVTAFEDLDGDGQRTVDEQALAGAFFQLSDANGPKDVYMTDGLHEPYCFTHLQSGDYQLEMEPPSGYVESTRKSANISLRSDTQVDVLFGVKFQASNPTGTPTVKASSVTPISGRATSGAAGTAMVVTVIAVVMGLGLILGFVSSGRR